MVERVLWRLLWAQVTLSTVLSGCVCAVGSEGGRWTHAGTWDRMPGHLQGALVPCTSGQGSNVEHGSQKASRSAYLIFREARFSELEDPGGQLILLQLAHGLSEQMRWKFRAAKTQVGRGSPNGEASPSLLTLCLVPEDSPRSPGPRGTPGLHPGSAPLATVRACAGVLCEGQNLF